MARGLVSGPCLWLLFFALIAFTLCLQENASSAFLGNSSLLSVSGTNVIPCQLRDPQLSSAGKVRKHKVLVLVNSVYFSSFHNWMIHFNRSCSGNVDALEIACLDSGVADLLPGLAMNVTCSRSLVPSKFTLPVSVLPSLPKAVEASHRASSLWFLRVFMLRQLLAEGYDVVLSDTDALWRSDPYVKLSHHIASSHVVASRGWFPRDLSKQWGSTLCMGFVYFRADPSTLRLVDLMHGHMVVTQQSFETYWSSRMHMASNGSMPSPESAGAVLYAADDQFSLNTVLWEVKIQWPKKMLQTHRSQSHRGTATLPGRMPLEVTQLAENDFLRNCVGEQPSKFGAERLPTEFIRRVVRKRVSGATVVHCLLAPGNSQWKQHYMVLYSLWRLPHNRTESLFAIYHEWKGKLDKPKRAKPGIR